MFVIVGFVFAILFGTKAITIVDPEAGFLLSIALLAFGIGEAANHKEVTSYETTKITHFDPYLDREYFMDEIRNSPFVRVPTGKTYVRKPVFVGIVLDAMAAVLFLAGVIKLFV